MGLTGDFGKLERLAKKLDDPWRELRLTAAAKEEVLEQYQADFAGARDPWGNPWAPSPTGGRPLIQSGALASPSVTSSRDIVRARPQRYWVFHQAGANGMPTRAVLPFSPSNWDDPIEARINEIVESYLESI